MLRHSEVNQLIGETAAVAYRTVLLAHSNLKRFSLFKYSSPPLLQQRIEITQFEQSIIEQALAIREATKIPFWEAVFSACIENGHCTEALLKATFYHNGQGTRIVYERRDLELDILAKATEGNARNISLCSEVFNEGNESLHLMFLDFHCDILLENTKIVRNVCIELMPQGFLIFDSGDSYHATSINLVSTKQRIHMLGKAILASPIVDSIYIAHQLQQHSSSLRISKGGKAKKSPKVVDAWSSMK